MSKIKIILIYSTRPTPKPLAFVKDPSDARAVIDSALVRSEMTLNARQQTAAEVGGAVSRAGLDKWRSARWAEIEIELDAP